MKKKLIVAGNTWQLYLNKPLVKFLGINDKEYSVLLKIDNKILSVSKINEKDIEKYKDLLIKKLIKRGSGYGLNLTLPVIELLEINPESDFINVEISNDILTIKKWSE